MRPTTEKVLLALFSILGSAEGKKTLELFAGSGRVSSKALQQGALAAYLVENSVPQAAKLRQSFRGEKNVEILCMDARRAIVFLEKKGISFHLVFADPPYERGWVKRLSGAASKPLAHLLEDSGVFVLEHSARERPGCEGSGNLELIETRKYGETCLSFFRRAGREEEEK